ncbi:hypothetical protein Poly30_38310 [Planctomycetes bacterium Poly30]|uniref:Uncharacterized protein n=1 Tax=Saltatorellus ferox TaxID=2528018 RepID=A0A518EW41_9BACT|nr:hypothetical protein Poly30_38310 [Planctomycetes bacterium Poly30]
MRPKTLLLATLAAILAGGLLFLLPGAPGSGGAGPVTVGPAGASVTVESSENVPLEGLSSAREHLVVEPARATTADPRSPTPMGLDGFAQVDLIVLDRDGAALLGNAGSLPPAERHWIRPVLGRGHPPAHREKLPAESLVELGSLPQRVSRRTGWLDSFQRPSGEVFVALVFGDYTVVSEPVDPGAREVVLISDLAEIEGMFARLEGRLPGMAQASTLVRARPEARPGPWPGYHIPAVEAVGEGDRFQVSLLPPGHVTLLVRGEASALQPALFAAKEASGLSAISRGATVPDVDQWKLRLGVLQKLDLPIADLEIELFPGESRDLGVLSLPRAAAAILELSDDKGRPVDATSVDVMVLGESSAAAPVSTWTFESTACLYPLHPEPSELMVVQGDLGALVKLFPASLSANEGTTAVPVRLTPLGVVALPEPGLGAPEPELWTAERRRVQNDPRWVGSTYLDHEIRGRTLAVPAGAYLARIGAQGDLAAVTVRSGEVLDLRGDGR